MVPDGTYGRIAPRSGLAWKNHVDVGAGVIDQDYRGNVGVVLFNHAETELVGKSTLTRPDPPDPPPRTDCILCVAQ